MLSGDDTLPYHRPPLSKRYLRREAERDDTFVEPESFYRDNEVEAVLETRVTGVDPRERAAETREGRRFGYDRLLVATGAVPRRLEVPGADLDNVFTLRSLSDSTAIREAAAEARDAVVVGGGFIGMEVAASLRRLDLDVTLVNRSRDLFSTLGSPEVSMHLVDLYRTRGVDVVQGDVVRAFRGRGAVDTVDLHVGDPLGADLVVVGIGVQPAVEFLNGSGVEVADGILVDERFRTSVPGIYAAGDVARFYDPLFGRRRRIEHWSNANYQGHEVGKILAGAAGAYDTVSTFFTESFDLTLKVFGDTSQHDERFYRGSFDRGRAIVFYVDGDRLVGTLLTGQDDETEQRLKDLIAARATVSDLESTGLLAR